MIKVGLISLGCAKNLVDSEVMLGSLVREGMELTDDASKADVLIVNTCGFIEASKQQSINVILKANELRETGNCRALIMAGCLTQRYPKELRSELPEVDAIVGLNEVPRIGEIVREVFERSCTGVLRAPKGEDSAVTDRSCSVYWSGPAKYVPDFSAPRVRLTPKHTAYVKIAEGCNHPCTFCSIPRIRGRHRSRLMQDVLAEIRALVADGCREINLISQDTTFYGKDLLPIPVTPRGANGLTRDDSDVLRFAQNGNREEETPSISSLLRSIQQIPGDFWVRLLYTHPFHWSDELIQTIAACDKVCRYVDIPLQHINDKILAAMRRETSGDYIRKLIRKIRAGITGIALRTTFIVGFPGEAEEQFDELVAFIEEAEFERLGVFQYSQEDHTPAGAITGQVPAAAKKRRYRRAMAAQQRVSRAIHQRCIGRMLRVLVDQPGIGRSHADAPEIDGTVHLTGRAEVGQFCNVRITGASEYDLTGEVVV
jgi:ribosomal protein S12 methylthiotransferase